MSKKAGVFPLLVGAVAGAAAVFFSDKKNQAKAKKIVAKGKASLEKLSAEVKKDPEAFARKMGQKVSKEVATQAKKLKKNFSKSK